jgi:hypothetical protein
MITKAEMLWPRGPKIIYRYGNAEINFTVDHSTGSVSYAAKIYDDRWGVRADLGPFPNVDAAIAAANAFVAWTQHVDADNAARGAAHEL